MKVGWWTAAPKVLWFGQEGWLVAGQIAGRMEVQALAALVLKFWELWGLRIAQAHCSE